MKQKLLSILALLMMAVPHSYAKVYESDLNIGGSLDEEENSATIDGIVIRVNHGTIYFIDRRWEGYDGANSFTISTELGETITGIEITCDESGLGGGTGWTDETPGAVWSGSATSVNVGQLLENVTHIKVTVADATVNVTANEGATGEYWATYYNATQGFTADANTTVFKAALTGNQLTMTEVANREIPAGKAVILKSTAATITLTPATTTATLEGNQLVGTATAITNPGNAYVLSKGAKGVGFYKLTSGGTIGANKAYLTYSAGAREFFLFDETTGIISVNGSGLMVNGSDGCYDLQGRRVQNPVKGLYIVNGKKVFINK